MPNAMLTFQHCKLELALEAQSPMIHFQADTAGVTLRASEAKPKLDRFLLAKLCEREGKNIDELKQSESYKSIFVSPKHTALHYKMQITSKDSVELITLGKKTDYKIFYGNTGNGPKKYGVFTNPTVAILCMNATLRALIEEYIVSFFLTTNFGTMQGKGFGSFAPICCGFGNALTAVQEKEIAAHLKAAYGAPACYAMQFEPMQDGNINAHCGNIFWNIRSFYQIMKSGQNPAGRPELDYIRSYIYTYMHQKDIGNEKAWMKRNGIANCAFQECNRELVNQMRRVVSPNGDRYVRAMLGIGDSITFSRDYKHKIDEKVVSIKSLGCGDAQLDRVPSPIYFKVVKNKVFILAKPLPEQIYEHCFSFDNNHEKGELSTPSKAEFNIYEFLQSYVDFYNNVLRTDARKLSESVEIKEVEA